MDPGDRAAAEGRQAGRLGRPLSDLAHDLGETERRAWRAGRDPDGSVLTGWSDDGLRHAMPRACRFAGVPSFGPHALRHRYVTRLVVAGVPLPLVRQVVGQAHR